MDLGSFFRVPLQHLCNPYLTLWWITCRAPRAHIGNSQVPFTPASTAGNQRGRSVACHATRELEAVMRGAKKGRRGRRGGEGSSSGDEGLFFGGMDGMDGLGGSGGNRGSGGSRGSGGGGGSWSPGESAWEFNGGGYSESARAQGLLYHFSWLFSGLCAISLLQALQVKKPAAAITASSLCPCLCRQ